MDTIGVGSLLVVVLVGFFSGIVMALQMSRALAQYGEVEKTGTLVAITLVRELGPVLTAIMVAGRNSSGIASELGSMKVTEQIDAMRALGTDPIQKLVTPRLDGHLLHAAAAHHDRRFRRSVRRLGDRRGEAAPRPRGCTGTRPGRRSNGTTWRRG